MNVQGSQFRHAFAVRPGRIANINTQKINSDNRKKYSANTTTVVPAIRKATALTTVSASTKYNATGIAARAIYLYYQLYLNYMQMVYLTINFIRGV